MNAVFSLYVCLCVVVKCEIKWSYETSEPTCVALNNQSFRAAVCNTITDQGRGAFTAEGAIANGTRLFHLFASKMLLTEEYWH